MLQRTALSLTVSYRFGVFFCFPVTVSSSPETCVCFSDCSQQCAAALTSLAALPLGYCFGLSRSTSTLLAWPASLIEFLIMSVSAANTWMKITYSSKWDIEWERLNTAATAWGRAVGRGKKEEAEEENNSRSIDRLQAKCSWWCLSAGNGVVTVVWLQHEEQGSLYLGWVRPQFLSIFSDCGSTCVQEKCLKSAPSSYRCNPVPLYWTSPADRSLCIPLQGWSLWREQEVQDQTLPKLGGGRSWNWLFPFQKQSWWHQLFQGEFHARSKNKGLPNQNENRVDELIICCNLYVCIQLVIYV